MAAQSQSTAAVVYVHGLWMAGAESLLLARHLRRRHGYRFVVFHYHSVRDGAEQISGALCDLLAAIEAPRVHLLGHSLGGAVILRSLARRPLERPGRVLFLGAPVLGSRAAALLGRTGIGRWRPGRRLLGATAVEALLQPPWRRWEERRELGIIAGTRPIGFGQLLGQFHEPNDGTVAVSETRLPGASAFMTVPVTHMGLLCSRTVARAAGCFFEQGRFGA